MSYVVTVLKGIKGTPNDELEYLCAIRYDRYQTGDANHHETTPELDDAHVFRTLEAAEMAAVYVGGQVKKLEQPCYLITYVWERDRRDITSMELWKGSIGEWMIHALEQPEHWRLVNAAEVTEEEYTRLNGHIG